MHGDNDCEAVIGVHVSTKQKDTGAKSLDAAYYRVLIYLQNVMNS